METAVQWLPTWTVAQKIYLNVYYQWYTSMYITNVYFHSYMYMIIYQWSSMYINMASWKIPHLVRWFPQPYISHDEPHQISAKAHEESFVINSHWLRKWNLAGCTVSDGQTGQWEQNWPERRHLDLSLSESSTHVLVYWESTGKSWDNYHARGCPKSPVELV